MNYQPNSSGGPVEDASFKEPPLAIGEVAERYDHREGNDDFTQAGNLFRILSASEQARLMDTIAEAMAGVPKEITDRQTGHFYIADPAYGDGIAERMNK